METKTHLANSLKELMNHKSLDQITIQEITASANLNRQTFYYHFTDIYDLLGWIFEMDIKESIQEKTFSWEERMEKSLNYIINHRKFCSNCFHSLGREKLEHFLYEKIYEALYQMIEKATENIHLSKKDKETLTNFYTYATIGLLIKWISDGMKEQPEEIIEHMKLLVSFNIQEVIKRYLKENA